MHQVKYY